MVIRMKPEIQAARELLKDLTPLKTDCGAYCGGACCKSDSADEEGMLLFPGEEAAYCDCAWARVKPAQFEGLSQAHILVCDGRCPRDERPLACRLFPVAPHKTAGGFKAALDRRAFAVCPLAGYGMSAFDRAFANACTQAFDALSQDDECREYLTAWSALMDEYARGL